MHHSGASRAAFRWSPQSETWLAFLSVPVMFLVYRTSTALAVSHGGVAEALFTSFGILGMATLLPIAVVRRSCGGMVRLGFTQNRLAASLAVSAVFAAGSLPAYFASVPAGGNGLLHLAASCMNLWEPLFVYGWLQLRFEDAFGWLPAPLIAALCFAIYHVGSVPGDALGPLALWGGIVGVLFATTRNLFVVFPLAWGVASAIGSASEVSTGWSAVVLAAGVLALQVIALRVLLPSRESPNKRFQQKAPPSEVDSGR